MGHGGSWWRLASTREKVSGPGSAGHKSLQKFSLLFGGGDTFTSLVGLHLTFFHFFAKGPVSK